jgi:hypothetical protein
MEILEKEKVKDLLQTFNIEKESEDNNWEEEKLQEAVEKEKTESFLEAMEKEDIINMRRLWSNFLLAVVLFVVIFDSIIFIGIGRSWFIYDDRVVPVFIVESLLKILGLALIVVKFLFNEKSLK